MNLIKCFSDVVALNLSGTKNPFNPAGLRVVNFSTWCRGYDIPDTTGSGPVEVICKYPLMRKLLLSIMILLMVNANAQQVTISGMAFDSTNGQNPVHIVVNDTLRKFLANGLPTRAEFQQLREDTTRSVFTKASGKFQITVRYGDSLFFQSLRHKEKVYSVSELLKMKSIDIRLVPETCIPYIPCKDTVPSKVYVFVGQKLKLQYVQQPYYCGVELMDDELLAEYRILEQKQGDFPGDTMRFSVFVHTGMPSFSKYQTVLLFVSEYCGKLIHEKYQYFDLYKTVEGKWASPGDPYKYDMYHRKEIKAGTIQFAEDVWFDVSKLNEQQRQQQFPGPYYKLEDQKAIPVMGTYVDDLIRVKKEGVLKARKLILN